MAACPLTPCYLHLSRDCGAPARQRVCWRGDRVTALATPIVRIQAGQAWIESFQVNPAETNSHVAVSALILADPPKAARRFVPSEMRPKTVRDYRGCPGRDEQARALHGSALANSRA